MANKKDIILVLGMHRSGTSALTSLLKLMGAYLGKPSDFPQKVYKDNPKGHYEHLSLLKLNETFLKKKGFAWNKLSQFDVNCYSDQLRQEYAEKFSAIVEQYPESCLALKDPRICLFFDFIKHLPYRYHCLYIVRDPVEVALSLCHRNGFGPKFSIALWRKYNTIALRAMKGNKGVVIFHHRLMYSPFSVAMEMHNFFKTNGINTLSMPTEDEVGQCIESRLHHQSASLDVFSNIASMNESAINTICARFACESDALLSQYERHPVASIKEIQDFCSALPLDKNVQKALAARFLSNWKAYRDSASIYQKLKGLLSRKLKITFTR